MQHKGTVTLETERLILRRITLADCEAAFRNWVNDAEVTKYLRWPPHGDISVTRAVYGDWVSAYVNDNRFYQWAIVPKALNEPIGTIGAVDMDDRTDKIHIGYCIGRAFWGQGYTAEALSCLITFFFEEVDANRIESQHDPNNPASGRVMQKCGMTYEGTLRAADYSNRGIVDACMYAILKRDHRE